MTFSNTPHLITVREVNKSDGTNLHEYWELESYNWHDASSLPEDPPVKVHVAPFTGSRSTGLDGLPPKDKRTTDSCRWSEVPEEIRHAFREEANRLQQATAKFQIDE